MLLEQQGYSREALSGKIVLLTGGGGGIGREAARAFSYMGAKVIIAEIDREGGTDAQNRINGEFGNENAEFFPIDLADERQIDALHAHIMEKYARLDALINNAAVVPMGAVGAVSICDWDLSYAVNLRAPVLLAQKFLPILEKSGGVIVFNPSAPGAYMSAYEIFKTAQVELCHALDVELAGTGITTYGVAPGFVKTATCINAVDTVASSMGIRADDFYATVDDIAVDAEIAGTGYAVSVVNAEKYRGQVIFSRQALADASLLGAEPKTPASPTRSHDIEKLLPLLQDITAIFGEQYDGWKKKNLFQRQFILGDFKKQMGLPADAFQRWLEKFHAETHAQQWVDIASDKEMLTKLQAFYAHQKELLAGFEKDPAQLAADTALLNQWIDLLQRIMNILSMREAHDGSPEG